MVRWAWTTFVWQRLISWKMRVPYSRDIGTGRCTAAPVTLYAREFIKKPIPDKCNHKRSLGFIFSSDREPEAKSKSYSLINAHSKIMYHITIPYATHQIYTPHQPPSR